MRRLGAGLSLCLALSGCADDAAGGKLSLPAKGAAIFRVR